MDAGQAYDAIASQCQEQKLARPPTAWSERLMHRWARMLPPAATVLDLGCGHGHEVTRMTDLGLRPVGLDLSRGMLQIARQHAPGRWMQADATRLPVRTASLEGAWSLHALMHVTDLDAALGELARAFKPCEIAALTLALGEGVTVEPVQYQPDVLRQFVHWSQRAALATVRRAHLEVLDTGVDTEGRTTLWMLTRRRQT